MKLGIMQPYFFPYIGYWQLMNAVDQYVIYDNIQFTKGGWIRRNRILLDGHDKLISLPLKSDSDYLNIDERYLSANFSKEKNKILNQIKQAYCKAPYFCDVFPILERCFDYEDHNLFAFLYNSIEKIKKYIGIETPLIISSTLEMDHSLKCEQKVMEICKLLNADQYYSAMGGWDLYSKDEFAQHGIEFIFLKTKDTIQYPQFGNGFIPNLSIIDVMMFRDVPTIQKMLLEYDLL